MSRVAELAAGAFARLATHTSYATRGRVHQRRTFNFAGANYRYHAHLYNTTWRNERTVEVPIVVQAISNRRGGRLLEVGNVLAHYGVSGHVVVDKYERAKGVVNADIVEFHDPDGFDLIVSISTLEHIGFEEETPDPIKPLRVVEHLAGLLKPGGEALVTFPLGYNPDLDELVRRSSQGFGDLRGLRRVSADNRWVEATVAELIGTRYGSPYPSANALAVARIVRS